MTGRCCLRRAPPIPRPEGLARAGDTPNPACPQNKEKWGTRKSLEWGPSYSSGEIPPALTRRGQFEVSTVLSVPTSGDSAQWRGRSGAERAAPKPLSAPPSLGVEFGRAGGGGPGGR